MAALEDDPRVQWLAAKACQGLSVDYSLFQELLESNPGSQTLISQYLDPADPGAARAALLVYLKVVDEPVELPEAEPVPDPDPAPEPEPETPGETGEDGANPDDDVAVEPVVETEPIAPETPGDADSSEEIKTGEANAAGTDAPANTDSDGAVAGTRSDTDAAETSGHVEPAMEEPGGMLAPEPDEEIEVQTVPVVKMDVCVGLLPEDAIVSRCFYFVTARSGSLDMSGLSELECGILVGGPSLATLESVLVKVYLPLLLGPGKADVSHAGLIAAEEHNEMLSSLQKFISQVLSREGKNVHGCDFLPSNPIHRHLYRRQNCRMWPTGRPHHAAAFWRHSTGDSGCSDWRGRTGHERLRSPLNTGACSGRLDYSSGICSADAGRESTSWKQPSGRD